MVNRERDDNVYYARLAEQGERYEDMIRYMKEVAAVSILLDKHPLIDPRGHESRLNRAVSVPGPNRLLFWLRMKAKLKRMC